MALDIRRLPTPTDESRPLRALPTPPPDPIGDEWLFGTKTKNAGPIRAAKAPRVNRRLVALLVVLLSAIAVLLVVRSLGSEPAPEPAAQSTARAASPDPSAVPAAPQPLAGIPMSIVSSNLAADPAARTYRVTVAIRNPTDVAAASITVQVSLSDGSGNVLRTEARQIEALASGRTATVEFRGEFDPQSQVPATVDVKAAAASSV